MTTRVMIAILSIMLFAPRHVRGADDFLLRAGECAQCHDMGIQKKHLYRCFSCGQKKLCSSGKTRKQKSCITKIEASSAVWGWTSHYEKLKDVKTVDFAKQDG